MASPIHHEHGHGYSLVWCQDCPPWRRLAGGRADSLLRAAEHLEAVHDDSTRAKRLREQARRLRDTRK